MEGYLSPYMPVMCVNSNMLTEHSQMVYQTQPRLCRQIYIAGANMRN